MNVVGVVLTKANNAIDRVVQTKNRPGKSSLPASGWSKHAQYLARRHAKGDVAQDQVGAVAKVDPSELDRQREGRRALAEL